MARPLAKSPEAKRPPLMPRASEIHQSGWRTRKHTDRRALRTRVEAASSATESASRYEDWPPHDLTDHG